MPHEFWALTMTEFKDLIEGYKWRDRRQWEKMAQLAVWTSQKLKKGTTVKKLLGNDQPKKKVSKEEAQANVINLVERLGKGLNISEVG